MAARVFQSRYGASISWFPGHMASSAAALVRAMSRADVVIEVRDARLPITCTHTNMGVLAQQHGKPRVVVFNKADLAQEALQARISGTLGRAGVPCVFTSVGRGQDASSQSHTQGHAVKAIIRHIDSITKPDQAKFTTAGVTALVMGLPNVGKSSLIRALKCATSTTRSRGPRTGAAPGVTKQVSTFLVREKPALYVFDSPGMMMPRVEDLETGLKLALCECIPEKLVPYEVLAEYLLYYFTGINAVRYVDALKLDRPYQIDEIDALLTDLAVRLHAKQPGGKLDLEAAARHMVRAFREGALGRYTLDWIPPAAS